MKNLLLSAVLVTLPLLLGGCGEKDVAETKPEEPVAETKPVEEVPLNPNLKYEIKGDAVTITSCDEGALGKLVIPTIIEGKPVTSIGHHAFYRCTNLSSITIGNAVTSIGERAFYNCEGLTSITIPDSVTIIFSFVFDGCTNLTDITISKSVTRIGQGAFVSCENLISVSFLGDVPYFGANIFLGATPTIYRKPEAKGWGDTFGKRPVKLISEKP